MVNEAISCQLRQWNIEHLTVTESLEFLEDRVTQEDSSSSDTENGAITSREEACEHMEEKSAEANQIGSTSPHSLRHLLMDANKFHILIADVSALGRYSDTELVDLFKNLSLNGNRKTLMLTSRIQTRNPTVIQGMMGGSLVALQKPMVRNHCLSPPLFPPFSPSFVFPSPPFPSITPSPLIQFTFKRYKLISLTFLSYSR